MQPNEFLGDFLTKADDLKRSVSAHNVVFYFMLMKNIYLDIKRSYPEPVECRLLYSQVRNSNF